MLRSTGRKRERQRALCSQSLCFLSDLYPGGARWHLFTGPAETLFTASGESTAAQPAKWLNHLCFGIVCALIVYYISLAASGQVSISSVSQPAVAFFALVMLFLDGVELRQRMRRDNSRNCVFQ